jgi:hypothetical protein
MANTKVYARPDTKIGNSVPILNRTTPSYVGGDRQKVPKGLSADEFNDYVNRKFNMERTPKDYFTSGAGFHIAEPNQWMKSTQKIHRPKETSRGGDRYPFQSQIDPPVISGGRISTVENDRYSEGLLSNFRNKNADKFKGTLNWRTS